MHSWSHVRTHENRHTHGAKGSFGRRPFPYSLSEPTRHHVSALGILLSPPSPEYDMAPGSHLSCTHTISLAAQDIWQTNWKQHFKHLTDKNNQRTTCWFTLWYLFVVQRTIFFLFHLVFSFAGQFPEWLFLPAFKSSDCQLRWTVFGLLTRQKGSSHPLLFDSHSGSNLAQAVLYFLVHFWNVFSTNIPLCDGLSGVRRSEGYNPVLRVSVDGKVRKISPCFSLLIW